MSLAVGRSNAESYQWGQASSGWHLLKSEQLSIIEELVPPGDCESRHFHRKSQQFFYVLEGVATIEIDGSTVDVHAGYGLHVPALSVHQLFNHSTMDLRFIVVSNPESHTDKVICDYEAGLSKS